MKNNLGAARYAWIALGGAAGAIARYAVGVAVTERYGVRLYWGTLVINMTACFVIGLVIEYLGRHAGLSEAWRYLIPVGFIGAYSTFSTFEFEAWTSASRGAWGNALLYVGVSVVGGFCCVGLGTWVGRVVR
jgi:CrcB protein